MDISTFYALFSATCFTLLGLWWNVLQLNSAWIGDDEERRAVGGVYLTFLLPAMAGLFAQVGGAETPIIWRVSFVAVAVVGCFSTLRLLRVLRSASDKRPRAKYLATLAIYVMVAVTGAFPEIAEPLDIKPIQAEAFLLILLVLAGHGMVWDFMVRRPPGGTHVRGYEE
jgi:cation transport ATPase